MKNKEDIKEIKEKSIGKPVIIKDVTEEFERLEKEITKNYATVEEVSKAFAHLSSRIDQIVEYLNKQVPEAKN